jgi:hypothetical protein
MGPCVEKCMNSTEVIVGKIESRTEARAPVGATAEQPRILDLLLRIPVSNTDWQPVPKATVGCGCERGRVCPFRALCLE